MCSVCRERNRILVPPYSTERHDQVCRARISAGLQYREPSRACWCSDVMNVMNHYTTRGGGAVSALLLILAVGCTTSPAASAQVHLSPSVPVHSFAGGCAGTVLTDARPPVWAQDGWSVVAKGTPWPVRWALGTQGDTVAYLFNTQLVAGVSPRSDGTANKILWEAKDSPSGANVLVEGHPLGSSQPVVTIAGGPSITDVPTAGCWTFRLSWGSNGQHSSTINLEALPAGTLPA
jgi:hypothetical protein